MAAMSKSYWDYSMYGIGFLWFLKHFLANTRLSRKGVVQDPKGRKSKEKKYPTFNKDFKKLMKLTFPKWNSSESFTLYAFVAVLLLRTWLSMVVANIDGFVVKQLINKDRRGIMMGIIYWLAIALPSSAVNALIRYLQSRLALQVRARLTTHARDLYFKNETYFRVSHLDKSVPNPEHALTEDISQWADRFAELASSLGKPLVDLVFFSSMLFKNLGFANQFIASVVVWETGQMLKWIRPNYGEIVQQRGSLEAGLRFQHTRVITASEEIAFCHGEKREEDILTRYFSKIVTFTKKTLREAILYATMEDFVTKYVWSTVGLVQVAIPLMKRGSSAGNNAKYFITIRRMMVRNGDATERLMIGIKDVAEFSGFTKRVMDMLNAFNNTENEATKNYGTVHVSKDDSIVIQNVPITTPTGDKLMREMDLKLETGDRLLILGPNGCGKSSLFRILCGLWPMKGGDISKPANRQDLYFLPQKPYLVEGSFRDQIIYPHTVEDMKNKGVTDENLHEILEKVLMTTVCAAHGGLDSTKEWVECLSGGEKQRLGLARVFYHQPKYAILDECSSAINIEAEQKIFTHLLESGMGLITITHRQTLFKFHTKLLTFDGEGGFSFNSSLQQDTLEDLSEKKVNICGDLMKVCRDLGEDWPKSFQEATK